jgi:hypothetical protein
MNSIRLPLVAAIAALLVSSAPTAALAASDSTGWITSNGRYVLAGCSVYSSWSTDHKTVDSSETVPCSGSVRAGIKISGQYYYTSWHSSYAYIVSSNVAATAHYSGYKS